MNSRLNTKSFLEAAASADGRAPELDRISPGRCEYFALSGYTLWLFLLAAMLFFTRLNLRAELVQNGGFEAGTLSGWNLTGDPLNTQVSVGFPHSGLYSVLFGAMDNAEYISQALATSPGQVYTLSFWVGSGDNGGGIPNQFIVKWGNSTLIAVTNFVKPSWTNMVFQVTANSTSTVLAFGGWDNLDYIFLDDVSVSIPSVSPPPKFLSAGTTNGVFSFSWSAVVGRDYQMQYITSFPQGTWINLGSPIRAATATVSGSDPLGYNQGRFYRVVLLP